MSLTTPATLDAKLRTLERQEERENFELQKRGRGTSNHRADIRLFDAPEGFDPEVTLYRDTAGWCPYCEKVWVQLEEKRIPYKVIKVPMRCYGDKPASFMRINPSGGIPVATIKGRTLTESNDIMFALEREFPANNPLIPPEEDVNGRALCNDLLKLERKVFACWFNWLTTRSFPRLNNQEKSIMHSLLVEVDTALARSGGPYFLGAELSIVDVMFTPFLERMAASLPYYKGFHSRSEDSYPHLFRWYTSMDGREAYQGIKSDYYTHVHDLPPQIGACQNAGDYERYQREVDGGAWQTDAALATMLEPMLPADPQEAARDAVRRTLSNFDAVVRFACRGAGEKGRKRVSAPLADPSAVPNEDCTGIVGEALGTVLAAMLEYCGPCDAAAVVFPARGGDGSAPAAAAATLSAAEKEAVRNSLEYLRERVGVPRDMTVHGARLFRAHINAYLQQLK